MSERFMITMRGSAIEHLEWAIELLVNHQAHIPAITLAAAAEDVLRKLFAGDTAMHDLQDVLALNTGLDRKVISDDHINRTKNWLKHGSKTEPSIIVDLQAEAVQYIARALTNLRRAGGPATPMEAVFEEWLSGKPDLTGLILDTP